MVYGLKASSCDPLKWYQRDATAMLNMHKEPSLNRVKFCATEYKTDLVLRYKEDPLMV